MIEEILLTYGPLGAWTFWLLYEKQKILLKFNKTLEANTNLLNKIAKRLQ